MPGDLEQVAFFVNCLPAFVNLGGFKTDGQSADRALRPIAENCACAHFSAPQFPNEIASTQQSLAIEDHGAPKAID